MNATIFIGLTREQQRILTQGGWDADPKNPRGPAPTLRAAHGLIARGLLTAGEAVYADKHGAYTLMVYSVPSHVATAWREWLASQGGDHAA